MAGETKRKVEQAVAGCLKGEGPADALAAGEGAPVMEIKNEGMRLPDDEVQWILARKKEYLTPGISTAEEIEAHKRLSDCFTEYQEWVREQYHANGGVVVLDDEQVEQRAKNQQLVQDIFEQVDDFSLVDLGVDISDRYSDFYESSDDDDDDEEEEEEEGEEVAQELSAN